MTPFVLAYLHEHSGGETRRVNRDLIVDNAGLAGEIAPRMPTSERRPMSLYDSVRDLPLVIDGYALDGLEQQVSSGFLRKTTVIRLARRRRGGGRRGRHLRRGRARPRSRRAARSSRSPATGRSTRSREHLATLPLFDHEPEQHAYLDYRRWAFESAALDLALRQAGSRSARRSAARRAR